MVFAAYYPAVFSGVSRFDDSALFAFLERQDFSLSQIFFPSASNGYYYRPILALSYFFDKEVLKLFPGLMHIENILLHLLNAILVYILTLRVKRIASPYARANSLLPLIAAALFALHPLLAESVNWIAGRTDILACMFILSSVLLLFSYQESGKKAYLLASVAAFLGGVLAKETAAAFLPGFLLIWHAHGKNSDGSMAGAGEIPRQAPWKTAAIGFGAIAVVLSGLLLRSLAFTSNTSRIGLTISAVSNDWLYSMLVVLRAFGFYMKKLIVPYPLNFSIMAVDPLYEVLAVPLALLCLYIAFRRTLLPAFFTAGIFLIFPAFIIAFGQIAWTPYAERYLYLPLAFIVIAAVIYIDSVLPDRWAAFMKVAVPAIALVMFTSTFMRSMLWLNEPLLIEDTVIKSPLSRNMRGMYGQLLAEQGRYDEAQKQIAAGRALPVLGVYDPQFDLAAAFITAKQGRFDDAIGLYEHILQKKKGRSPLVLQNLVLLLQIKKDSTTEERARQRLDRKIVSYNRRLADLTRDPLLLYHLGKDASALGMRQEAVKYYQEAYDLLPQDDPYRQIIVRRIKRIAVRRS